MSSAAKSPVKSALESALVAFLIFGGCLWLLVSGTEDGADIPAGRGVLCGLGMSIGLIAHWVYMAIAAKRAGRNVLGWTVLMVLTMPIASVVLAILLTNQEESEQGSRTA